MSANGGTSDTSQAAMNLSLGPAMEERRSQFAIATLFLRRCQETCWRIDQPLLSGSLPTEP